MLLMLLLLLTKLALLQMLSFFNLSHLGLVVLAFALGRTVNGLADSRQSISRTLL